MNNDNIEFFIETLFKQQARGILSKQEVVDFALGFLAFNSRFDLIEQVTLALTEKFSREVTLWAEWDGNDSQSTFHWMPYNDSRLVSEYFGGIAGGEYTQEQKSKFIAEMRDNLHGVVQRVRQIINQSE